MSDKSNINIKKILILFLSIVLCIINDATTSCIVQVSSFWTFLVLVVIIMKADFLHPYVWFLGMHTVYYTAYPILSIIYNEYQYGYSNQPMFYASIAILVFVIVVPATHNNGHINNKNSDHIGLNRKFQHIMTIIILVSIIFIKALGYSSKVEIYSSNPILTMVFSLVLIYINVYTLDFCDQLCVHNKVDVKLILETFLSVFLLTMFSGERDLLLRFLLVTVLTLFFFNVIDKRKLVIFILSFVTVIIPMSVKYKTFFLSGRIVETSESKGVRGVISSFLSGEFESASRNLQIIINNEESTKGIMSGKTLINDVTTIFGYAPNSGLKWFQNTFYHGHRTGMGFTLVGEGYINFGIIGIIIVYLIIGIFSRILYKNYRNSIYTFFFYISSIPLLIYASRADLANIFSPFVKHTLLSAVLFYLLKEKFVAKRNLNTVRLNNEIGENKNEFR